MSEPAAQVFRRPTALEWVALLILTGAATGGIWWFVAPGLMSYDSLLFWREAVEGVTLSTWPPAYAYLIQITRALGGGYGTLFLVQDAAVFGFGGYLVLTLARGPLALRLAALGVFFLLFPIVPAMLGPALVLWNSTPMLAFALAGMCLHAVAIRRGALAPALAAPLAYALAFSMRYDTLFLVAPALLALLVWPVGARSGARERLFVGVVTAVTFAVAWVSFSHRLPDLKPLRRNAGVQIIQVFDLIGTSAECGENLLPAQLAGGMSPQAIRSHYDPRHLNLSMASKPGLPDFGTAKPQPIDRAWRAAVAHRPYCYLRHRLAVFTEQMGLAPGEVFYPTHVGGIDANPFGFTLAHPRRAAALIAYVDSHAARIWRRPIWLYVLAVGATAWLAWRRDPRALPLALITLGALGYAGSRLFASPAADARYIFGSDVLCAVVAAAAVSGGLARRGARETSARRDPGFLSDR